MRQKFIDHFKWVIWIYMYVFPGLWPYLFMSFTFFFFSLLSQRCWCDYRCFRCVAAFCSFLSTSKTNEKALVSFPIINHSGIWICILVCFIFFFRNDGWTERTLVENIIRLICYMYWIRSLTFFVHWDTHDIESFEFIWM